MKKSVDIIKEESEAKNIDSFEDSENEKVTSLDDLDAAPEDIDELFIEPPLLDYDGEPTVMTKNNGVYEFNIAQGDGVFVTVE